MSSSFVKDCSDVSAPGNSSSGKTVIIIVNNETGNVCLDQDELQNLLASHGADGSQVSVVRMGSGGIIGNAGEIVTSPSIVAAADGTAHVNFTVEGYPAVPLEGGGINYAELPLDQDAFQRLESVLDSEEAREILGGPLLSMVTNPDQFDQLMDSSLFEGTDQDDDEDGDDADVDADVAENVSNEGSSSTSKKSRSPPKRRSQRQMDKAEREEVEKILAENQKILKEEKQQINEQQILIKMQKMNTIEEKTEDEKDQREEEKEEVEEEKEGEEEDDSDEVESGDEETEEIASKDDKVGGVAGKKGKGDKSEIVESKLKGKGRGKIRVKGKVEIEKGKTQETKGKGKGKKKIKEEQQGVVGVGRGSGSKGKGKEDSVGAVKGRGRGILRKEEKEGPAVGKKKSETGSAEKSGNPVNRRRKTGEKESDEVNDKTKTQKANKKGDAEKVNKVDSEEKSIKKSNKDVHKVNPKSAVVNTKNNANTKRTGNQKEEKDSDAESDKKLKLRRGVKGSDEDFVEVKSSETHNKVQESNSSKISIGGRRKLVRTINKDGDDVTKSMSEAVVSNKMDTVSIKDETNSQLKKETDAETNVTETQNSSVKIRTGVRKLQIRTGRKGAEVEMPDQKTFLKEEEEERMELNPNTQDEKIVAGFNMGSTGLQIKSLKVSVEKMNIQEALEKELLSGIDMDSSSEIYGNVEEPKKDTNTKDSLTVFRDGVRKDMNISAITKPSSEPTRNINIMGSCDSPLTSKLAETIFDTKKDTDILPPPKLTEEPGKSADLMKKNSKCIVATPKLTKVSGRDTDWKAIPATPKLISDFQPSLFSTPLTTLKGEEATPDQTLIFKKAKSSKGQNILLDKKSNPEEEMDKMHADVEKMETGKLIVSNTTPLKKPEVIVLKTKVQENVHSLAANKGFEKEESEANGRKISEMSFVEGKSRLIQVKSPMGVRQVVVLNSAKATMNKETLVKVIAPIDPPREEDRLSVAKICATARKEAAQKKKLDHKKKNAEAEALNNVEIVESKEKHEVDGIANEGMTPKGKGKIEVKSSKVETNTKREGAAPKIVDLEMKLEDSVQVKKREAQKKREEIQRKREELARKREAIKLRREQQMKESLQMKKEENNEQSEQENKVEKSIPKSKGPSVVEKNQLPDILKRNNSQEPQEVKKEIKGGIGISKKGQGQKTSTQEVLLTSKVKGQVPTPKNMVSEGPQKAKVQVTITKNQVTPKKNLKKGPEVTITKRNANSRKSVEVKAVNIGAEDSPVRRSGRAIKKKTFGDEMLTFDLKEDIVPEVEGEPESEEDAVSEMDEDEDSIEDYDDPERLWCICQKPHNNRFMICCDRCEDWFHGSCVNITKAIGQQMEDEGLEWVCPKCKKMEKALKGISASSKKETVSMPSESALQAVPLSQKTKAVAKSNAIIDTKIDPKKGAIKSVSKKEVSVGQPVSKNITVIGKKVEVPGESSKSVGKTLQEEEEEKESGMPQELPSTSGVSKESLLSYKASSSSEIASSSKEAVDGEGKCVLESCNRSPKADSVYCSNECVLKHAQLSLKLLGKTDKDLEEHQIPGAATATLKSEPRVLVYEKSTGKILSGSEAPSLREVKAWLKDHPEYAVLQPGMMRASGAVVKTIPGTDPLGGQKKVIHLSTQPSVKATPPKLTVVKSADGRIIVKATEAITKGIVSKIISTTTMPSVNKTVVVNSLKTAVVSVKDTENKLSESESKVVEPTSVKSSESLTRKKSVDSIIIKKNTESVIKKNTETNPAKKNMESSPSKKKMESIPTKKNVESIPLKKNNDIVSTKMVESPTKNTESLSFKNIDSVNLKNVESLPTTLPDTPSSKVTSPIKDTKKTPLKPATGEKKTADPNIVRSSVRKTLADCLLKRSKEAHKEFEDLTEEDICELTEEIEEELYLFFGKDVGFKYKSRYRSLLFNIKDTKNSGLFRKILNGKISPSNLAKMTPEELANKELAEWRQQEEKKELQAIEKYELDMISLGNQYIMKSHKGEIEIDKDEFIKDKEKAPETINSLPADPMMDLLEDTTSNHNNHMYDMKCKICTGQQVSSTDLRFKGKRQDKKDHKDSTRSDPMKVRDRKDRKSSTDKDRKEKDRHRHKSREHDKDRDKKHKSEKSKERDRDKDDKSKSKTTDKEKKEGDKEKHRSRKDSDRERHRSADKKDKRDREEKDRRHRHKKDRDEKDRKRKDSDRDERKRKHSESRSDDRKRRESEKSRQKETPDITDLESDKMEREKVVVSTSEDVVMDLHRSRRESFSHLDAEAKDAVPTSTVVGSPDILEIRDDGYTSSYENRPCGSPPMFHINPSIPPLPLDYPEYIPPPLPGDEAPVPPPLPDSPPTPPLTDIPVTPPLPDSPATPPLPDSLLESPKTPSLPDEICLSPSIEDDDDFPATPPLPDIDEDDDIPATPPLSTERDVTVLYEDCSSTPPWPHSKSGLPSVHSSGVTVDIDRLTPPLENIHSGVTSPVPLKSAEPVIVWKGAIHMADVSKFYASAFEVSGKARFLPEDVPKVVEVVGRISPDTVWSYIAQTKKTGSKEILVVRFQPSNEEEKVSYIALYSYLSSKKRYGVIGNCEKTVKDFYVVPLASHQPIPQVLLPLDGPGFEEHRAHMLIGVVIRAKQRRIYDHITGTWQIIGGNNNTQNNSVHKASEVPERSYTPPLPTDQDIEEIVLATTDSSEDEAKFKERSTTPPLTKRDRDEDSSEFLHPSSLKRLSRTQSDSDQPKKRVSLDERVQDLAETFLKKDLKSPKESSFAEGSLDQESMLAELNRQIEVHKKELSEMQKTVLNEEEEPYSPSRSTTASPGDEPLKLDTSKINIPSNLQEILNNIKEKEVEIKNKEQEIQRRLSLATDPIVMNYGKLQDAEVKSRDNKTASHSDVDLRPVLQCKPKDIEHKEDVDLRLLQRMDVKEPSINSEVFGKNDDTDLRVRDPRLARAHAAAVMEAIEKGKALSKLTDEELLAKALEMEGKEKNSSRPSQISPDVDPMYQPVPPPPFMAAGPSGFIPQPANTMACPQPPGIVGPPFISPMVPPAQPVGMYGPPGGRNQGTQGPSSLSGPPGVPEPPGTLGLHRMPDRNPPIGPCGPPIHDAPGLQGCGTSSLEPPQRYGESSRYQDDSQWERGYSNRDWEYNYDRYRDSDRYRDGERYRDGDHYRGEHYRERAGERDRDWRRREDRDGSYQRHPYNRRNKQFDSRGGSGGNHERRRDRSYEGRSRKKKNRDKSKKKWDNYGNTQSKTNDFKDHRESTKGPQEDEEDFKKWGNYDNTKSKSVDFKDNRESTRGPQEDEDDCPYEIDY